MNAQRRIDIPGEHYRVYTVIMMMMVTNWTLIVYWVTRSLRKIILFISQNILNCVCVVSNLVFGSFGTPTKFYLGRYQVFQMKNGITIGLLCQPQLIVIVLVGIFSGLKLVNTVPTFCAISFEIFVCTKDIRIHSLCRSTSENRHYDPQTYHEKTHCPHRPLSSRFYVPLN